MKRTQLITAGTLIASLGIGACDEGTPVGVPDEMKTEKSLEGWSKDMVGEARTEGEAPANVDNDYRPGPKGGNTDYRPSDTEAQSADLGEESAQEKRAE